MNDKFLITNPVYNLVEFYNGIDIITSASGSEGTSNVLLEALACNTHCVATKVGDNSKIINNKDFLFLPKRSDRLAKCWIEKIKLIRENVKENFRDHVEKNYSISNLTSEHESIFIDLLTNHR